MRVATESCLTAQAGLALMDVQVSLQLLILSPLPTSADFTDTDIVPSLRLYSFYYFIPGFNLE